MPSDVMRLAYARVQKDLARRVFYRHPYELRFLAVSPEEWLDDISALCDRGAYVADPSPSLEVPKPNWHVRPGLALSLRDQLAYHYVTLQALPVVAPLLDWSAYSVRFSYRLSLRGPSWFQNEFGGWKNFDQVSLAKIHSGASHVLVSDVSGYYENIEIGRLVQELLAVQVEPVVCDQLARLWNKWCGVRRRGIPQGFSPSHVFGEFFLDPVDKALRGYGLDHLRYLDDIRVFAGSESDARKALHELARVLRERGLNLQTAKTEVLPAGKAMERFSTVKVSLSRVSRRIADELRGLAEFGDYVDPEDIRKYLASDPDHPSPAVVDRAWESFVRGDFGSFNKTLLHYLLTSLADLGSPAAAAFCLALPSERPEETYHALRYLSRVRERLDLAAHNRLAALLTGQDLLYDYQRYLLLDWFLTNRVSHGDVLAYCRRACGPQAPEFIRACAVAYLSNHAGDATDFGRLERQLQNETATLMRATMLYALRLAPAPTRNLWFGRCDGESPLIDRAIRCAKADAQ